VRMARVGLIKKGFCALVEDGKRQYLTPTYKGGCVSFRSGQEDKTGSKRSADRNDPDQSDPQRGSFRSASADQNDPTALYIKKECIKRNVLRETKEGLSPQVASLPSPSAHCVSDFSSAVVIPDEIQDMTYRPPFVSTCSKMEHTQVAETDFGNLPQAITLHGVTYTISKPVNASGSANGTTGHSDTSVGMVQGQEGGKMEPVGASAPTISKPKSSKPKKAKSYTEYAEHDFFWPEHWGKRGRQALQTWVEYKRDTGKAVLLQSYQQAIKNFIGDESGFVLAVDHSIANAYQGLYKPNGNQLREAQKQQQQTQVESTDWHDRLAELLAMEN